MSIIGGAVIGWPRFGLAQTSTHRSLVAVLSSIPSDVQPERMSALASGIEETGLVLGRDYDIAYRSTGGEPNRLPELLNELIGLTPLVIVTTDTRLTLATKRATNEIPIVGVGVADPVGLGLATTRARPDSNVTGMLAGEDTIPGKRLELLSQLVPGATRIAGLINSSNPGNVAGLSNLAAAAATLRITLVSAEIRSAAELDAAFQTFAREHDDAVWVAQDGLFVANKERIVALALAARLPTSFGSVEQVKVGGLMSYGLNRNDLYRRAGAGYVGKILTGAKPADLPFELPSKMELVINLKTAKALSLAVPQLLLARADELIE